MNDLRSKSVGEIHTESNPLKDNTPPCGDLKYLKFCSEKLRSILYCNTVYLNRPKDMADGIVNLNKLTLLESAETKDKNMYFRIQGRSMKPILMPGDIVMIKPSPIHRIRVGEIIVYSTHRRLVCHRVIKKYWVEGKIMMVTKGDRSFSYDKPIQVVQILGKVVGMIDVNEESHFKKFNYLKYAWFWQIKDRIKRILILFGGFKFYRLIMRYIWQGIVSYSLDSRELSSGRCSLQDKKEFCVIANLGNMKIASLTSILRPEGCPYNGWWIHRVYVRVPYRGGGIASQLLKVALEIIKKEKISKIRLSLLENNYPALRLYKNFGFRQTYAFNLEERHKRILREKNLSMIIMEKEL